MSPNNAGKIELLDKPVNVNVLNTNSIAQLMLSLPCATISYDVNKMSAVATAYLLPENLVCDTTRKTMKLTRLSSLERFTSDGKMMKVDQSPFYNVCRYCSVFASSFNKIVNG